MQKIRRENEMKEVKMAAVKGYNNYGPEFVLNNGEIISPIQQAYILNDRQYTAAYHGKSGAEYNVLWEITNKDCDESEVCDWDSPESINKI
jgi:hypothetical protein